MLNPNEQAPIPDATLAQHLVRLLASHGVHSTLRGTDILVEGNEATWARLYSEPGNTPDYLRIYVEAATPGGTVLSDWVNGYGNDVQAQIDDALTQFCIVDFHVLLASVWGLLEEDQVDHHVVFTDNGKWDLYLGSWLSKMTSPAESIPPPTQAFAASLQSAASRVLTERKPTSGRLFVGTFRGKMTYEALVDGEPSTELETLLRSLPLEHSVKEFASLKHFFVAVPHDGITAHRRVSRCTKTESERAQTRLRYRAALAGTVVAAVVAAAAYLLR